jgi:hypothetical protein
MMMTPHPVHSVVV